MIEQHDADCNGMVCRWLSNKQVRLAITTGRGPRVVFCGVGAGRNLLAETPDFVLPSPNGPLGLLGGHRLWYAPELPERTYWPDDRPVTVEELPLGARFTAAVDGAGIEKSFALTLAADEPTVTVSHRLRNTGGDAIELAPWALTMVPLGGVTLLPQPHGNVDEAGLLPNRFLSLWPYSDPTDPRLRWGNRIVLVRGTPGPANKLGYRNAHGWLAHWLDGTLLVKTFPANLDARHPDNGCNAECYLNDEFMEVESLGGLIDLAPGASVEHEEVWRFYEGIELPEDEAAAIGIADRLGLWSA
jgi:hypothetical protein